MTYRRTAIVAAVAQVPKGKAPPLIEHPLSQPSPGAACVPAPLPTTGLVVDALCWQVHKSGAARLRSTAQSAEVLPVGSVTVGPNAALA